MTQEILNYLESLTVAHKDFNHNPNGKIAYYEFDWVGMMDVGRKRNDVILYVHKILGRYTDNQGDYQSDTSNVTFLIIKKVPAKSMKKSRGALLACKTYGEEFIAKMRHDRDNSFDEAVCAVLGKLLFKEITYEQTELTADGWIGMQFRLPFRSELATTYEADQWTV